MSINLDQVKRFLRIDYDYDDEDLKLYIEAAQIYIDMMVGEYYKTDEKAIKLSEILQRKIVAAMYDERVTDVPETTKRDAITLSILDKLGNYTA